jgi:hypothetical protein
MLSPYRLLDLTTECCKANMVALGHGGLGSYMMLPELYLRHSCGFDCKKQRQALASFALENLLEPATLSIKERAQSSMSAVFDYASRKLYFCGFPCR